MLAKVSWWDRESGVGIANDPDGTNYHISDDMIDEDELKSSIKAGSVVNLESNPSIENAAMRVSMSGPEDVEKYNTDQGAAAKAMESVKQKANLTEATELNPSKVKEEAPYDLKEYVDLILDRASDHTPDSIKEVLEDDDALAEMADSHVDVYNKQLWDWYCEDMSRGEYIDEAIDEGLADPKQGIIHLLMVGQYAYHSQHLQEAKQWLEDYLDELPEEEETADESVLRNVTQIIERAETIPYNGFQIVVSPDETVGFQPKYTSRIKGKGNKLVSAGEFKTKDQAVDKAKTMIDNGLKEEKEVRFFKDRKVAQKYSDDFVPPTAEPEVVRVPKGYAIKMYNQDSDKEKGIKKGFFHDVNPKEGAEIGGLG
jgi:hypothetical protein